MVFDYFESSLGLKNEGILKNIKDRIFSHGVGFSSEKSKQPKAAAACCTSKATHETLLVCTIQSILPVAKLLSSTYSSYSY